MTEVNLVFDNSLFATFIHTYKMCFYIRIWVLRTFLFLKHELKNVDLNQLLRIRLLKIVVVIQIYKKQVNE